MKRLLLALLSGSIFLIPSLAAASATISSVTLNGGSVVSVDPGANITAVVTTVLTNKTKWKGTDWGINNTGATPYCENSKNAKDGTRNTDGPYTETLSIKAPA